MKRNLMFGDCLERMKDIPDNSIDLCLTDPPYGTTVCKWDNVIDFELMWEQLHRVVKDNGAIVLFGSEPFSSALRMSNIKNFKYDWIWNKVGVSSPFLAKKRPLKTHEMISVFYLKQCNYYPIKTKGKKWHRGGKSQSSTTETKGKALLNNNKGDTTDMKFPKQIIKFSNANRANNVHPTQKPVTLLEYLIKTYTLENETVLDFTMGSGSTGVACKNLNRNFIGIEKDEKYFRIAEQRIEDE
jgi:DNA modification methylase